MSELTQILSVMAPRESRQAEELLPIVYDELRRLAAFRLAVEMGVPRESLANVRMCECDCVQED